MLVLVYAEVQETGTVIIIIIAGAAGEVLWQELH